jgi:hypothetical protein
VCCHFIRTAHNVPSVPTTQPTGVEYLTPAQAAKRLGVSPRTLWRYQDAGRVQPVLLPSGHRRFLLSDIDALLTVDTTPPQSPVAAQP